MTRKLHMLLYKCMIYANLFIYVPWIIIQVHMCCLDI